MPLTDIFRFMLIIVVSTLVLLSVVMALVYLRLQDRRADRALPERNTTLTEPDLDFSTLPSEKPDSIKEEESAEPYYFNDRSSKPASPKLDKPNNWTSALQEVRQLRNAEKLLQAQSLCMDFLPRSQAFQQLILTQRAILREKMDKQEDATKELDTLYNTAVLAALYEGSKDLPEAVQTPVFAREALKRMGAEFSQVGYEKLENLRKTDITLLRNRWGEPMSHQHPLDVYPEQWWKLA